MGIDNCCRCKGNTEKEEMSERTDLTGEKSKVLYEVPIYSPVPIQVKDIKNKSNNKHQNNEIIMIQENAYFNELPLKSRAKVHRITERIQTKKLVRAIRSFLNLKREIQQKEKGFRMTGAVMGINIENGEKSTTLYNRSNTFGVRKWENGSWYSGQFSEGSCSGYGKYTNQYGDTLIGIFSNNKVSYYCRYHHLKGGFYDGQWKNNMIHGIGREEWKDNSSYEGTYVQGTKEGIGTYIWSNKSIYQGQWTNNSPHGHGIFKYYDGRRYEGEWSQGKKNGIGLFTWPDGKKYLGTYENDKLSGLVIWINNKQNGFAKIVTEQQENYSLWKDGKKITDYNNISSFFNDLSIRHPKLVRLYKMTYHELYRLSMI